MDDLKKLSVERLRELARKHLGKGHSRLRTRAELLAALKQALREPLSRLLDAAESVMPQARKKVRVVDFPPGHKGRVRPEHTTSGADAPATPPREPHTRGGPPRAESAPASPRAHAASKGAGRTSGPRKQAAPPSPRQPPTPETRASASPGEPRPASSRSRAAADASRTS